jgi:opacity protein-like surface antigen
MMRIPLAAPVVLAIVFSASPAQAQWDAWGTNGYLGFNGLYQTSTLTFDEQTTFDLNQERATVSASHEIEAAPAWELSGGGRVYKNLGFGFATSYFKHRNGAQIRAGLPHPFFFERPRAVSGEADGLRREEIAIHLDAMVLVPLTERFQITVFGGPSFFRLKQGLVAGVRFNEEYPYDEAQFVGVTETLTEGQWSKFAYNVGAEASVYFTQYLGVGVSVRHSDGDVEFDRAAGPFEVKVGGTQVGAGLRVRF